jgi:outer membrane protein
MKTTFIYHIMLAGLTVLPLGTLSAQSKPLSLQEAVSHALSHNKDLQVQTLEREKALQSVREAKSNLLPSVNAAGSYSYYFSKPVIFMPGSLTGQAEEPVLDVAVGGKNAFNTTLTVTQPLLSEASRQKVKSTQMAEQITKEKTTALRSEVIRQVHAHYYSILLLQKQLELLHQSLERNKQALADSRSLLSQGRALVVDTLRNYIALQNLKPTISSLQNRLSISAAELKTLIGLQTEEEISLSDSLVTDLFSMEKPISFDQALEIALQLRPDVKSQALSVELSKKQIEATKAEKLPSLWAVGQFQVQGQADNKSLTNYNWPNTSFLGGQLVVPIFSGFKTDSRIKQSKISYQQQSIGLSYLKEKISNEIASRLALLQEAHERWSVNAQTVQSAQVSYTTIRDRYKQGLSSRLEFTDAELALSQAKMNQLQSVFDLHMAQLDLEKALGRL